LLVGLPRTCWGAYNGHPDPLAESRGHFAVEKGGSGSGKDRRKERGGINEREWREAKEGKVDPPNKNPVYGPGAKLVSLKFCHCEAFGIMELLDTHE